MRIAVDVLSTHDTARHLIPPHSCSNLYITKQTHYFVRPSDKPFSSWFDSYVVNSAHYDPIWKQTLASCPCCAYVFANQLHFHTIFLQPGPFAPSNDMSTHSLDSRDCRRDDVRYPRNPAVTFPSGQLGRISAQPQSILPIIETGRSRINQEKHWVKCALRMAWK